MRETKHRIRHPHRRPSSVSGARILSGGEKMGNQSDDEKRAAEQPNPLASEDRVEAKIDRDLKDSFPASDPPGWVTGVRRPREGEEEAEEGDAAPPPSP